MAGNLKLRCDCGTLQGVVSDVAPSAGSHVICYCEDCQAFAHYLNRSGQVLNKNGGSDIFQMSQGRITITSGSEHLACMRLTPKGLLRWYASCCNAPIGNTMASSALPFTGMVTTCMTAVDDASSFEPLGPVIAHVYRKFAKGNPKDIAPDRMAMPLVFLRAMALLLRWKLRGDSKRSAFFDAASGKPKASPQVLSDTKRAALRSKVAGDMPLQS